MKYERMGRPTGFGPRTVVDTEFLRYESTAPREHVRDALQDIVIRGSGLDPDQNPSDDQVRVPGVYGKYK